MKNIIFKGLALFAFTVLSIVACKKESLPLDDKLTNNPEVSALARGGEEVFVISEESYDASENAKGTGYSGCFGEADWANSTKLTYSNGAVVVVTPVNSKSEAAYVVSVTTGKGETTSFVLKTSPNGEKGENFTLGMYTTGCDLLHESYFENGEYVGGTNHLESFPELKGTQLGNYAEKLWENAGKLPCVKEGLACIIAIFGPGGWIIPCLKFLVCVIEAIFD